MTARVIQSLFLLVLVARVAVTLRTAVFALLVLCSVLRLVFGLLFLFSCSMVLLHCTLLPRTCLRETCPGQAALEALDVLPDTFMVVLCTGDDVFCHPQSKKLSYLPQQTSFHLASESCCDHGGQSEAG